MAVNYIHVVLAMVVLFVPRGDCLSCYKCTSVRSWKPRDYSLPGWDDCNSKQTETTCPSGSTQCLVGILTCTSNDVTKKVFVKSCSAPNSDDCKFTTEDAPSCPTPSMSWRVSNSTDCCSGNNCNSGTSHSINRVVLGICMALIFCALASVC